MASKSEAKSEGKTSKGKAKAPAAKPAAAKPGKGDAKAAAQAERPQPPAIVSDEDRQAARERVAKLGRNDPCHCGSGKKYKKCHLAADEVMAAEPVKPPSADDLIARGWRLFEQRRPGAAEKEFRAALAVAPDSADAMVGAGMALLQAGEPDAARTDLGQAVEASKELAARLKREKVTDAFMKPEAQAYIRACHALGCLAYDQERYDDTVKDLARVYEIDEGTVGTEARLVSAKAFVKLGKHDEAIKVLEPARASETGGSRAEMGTALAHFLAGRKNEAGAALGRALEANPHFAKAITGHLRRQVDAAAGAVGGTPEEAVLYAQTYGDSWTAEAKAFVEEIAEKPE